MKKMMQQLRDQSEEQLLNRLEDLDEEYFQLKNELSMQRKLERSHLLNEKRKEKARILTLLTERKKND